jgi:protein-disulfide isomerase
MRLALALTALLATPAMADMTPAERDAFRAEVRAYLLENPDVLVEALDVYQAQQEALAVQADALLVQQYKDQLINDATSWIGGNPDGDITMVEFMDYRCGYCRKAFAEVEELVKSDGNIRIIVKQYPILGEQSLLSSQFAIAVKRLHGPDAYKNAHNALISLRGDATTETLGQLATDLGHNADAILLAMTSPEVTAEIQANHALGQAMQISGTPTFVIQDTLLRGYVPLDDMRAIVADERAG